MVKKRLDVLYAFLLAVCALIVVSPVFLTVLFSFEDYGKSYIDFLIWNPYYLNALINSLFISLTASFGTILVSVPAAYVFTKVNFRGRGLLFYIYIIVMMMPFQVTLLPQYIVSKSFQLYDTPFSIILPSFFAPFAAFLLTQVMKSVPNEIIEAARLDTGSTFVILSRIIVPAIRPGILCAWVLVFTEQWNAVTEPAILMETRERFPLAVLLHEIEAGDILGFAAAVVFLLIPLLIFLFFESEVMEGLGEYRLK